CLYYECAEVLLAARQLPLDSLDHRGDVFCELNVGQLPVAYLRSHAEGGPAPNARRASHPCNHGFHGRVRRDGGRDLASGAQVLTEYLAYPGHHGRVGEEE